MINPPITSANLNAMRLVLFVLAMAFGLAYPQTYLYWIIWGLVAVLEVYGFVVLKEHSVINKISLLLSIVYLIICAFIFIGI